MKYLKKLISVVLTVVMLCTLMCTANAAGSYFLKDGFYIGVDDGEAYVHGADESLWDVVIPETFLDYNVTSVEALAFFEHPSIEVLSFYEAHYLTSLGDAAFARCTKLKKVHITETIQHMGTGVFEGCTALRYVRYRDGALTDVAAQSFYGCTAADGGFRKRDHKHRQFCLCRVQLPEKAGDPEVGHIYIQNRLPQRYGADPRSLVRKLRAQLCARK